MLALEFPYFQMFQKVRSGRTVTWNAQKARLEMEFVSVVPSPRGHRARMHCSARR